MNYGIQLYSVRDIAKESLEDTVSKMAQLGYSSVEFAGFFDRTPEQVTKMLLDNGIEISSTHSSLNDLINNYNTTVDYHKAIGNKYYIIPGYKLNNQAEIDYFIEKVNELYPRLKEQGITLGFHNHDNEFIPNPDGSVAFEQILYRTSIALEVDTYWAYVGMGDPIAILERAGDRLVAVHIKDGDKNGDGKPLGLGTAPVKSVYDWAVSRNIPLIVESETCNPSGWDEAKICIDYLKTPE